MKIECLRCGKEFDPKNANDLYGPKCSRHINSLFEEAVNSDPEHKNLSKKDNDGYYKSFKDYMNGLFKKHKDYLEDDFFIKIKQNFEGMGFELFLLEKFKNFVDKRRTEFPDIYFKSGELIECTTISKGTGSLQIDAYPEAEDEPVFINTEPMNDQIQVRLFNCIRNKYENDILKRIEENPSLEKQPIILAISLGKISQYNFSDIPLMAKTLFGLENKQYGIDTKTGKVVGVKIKQRVNVLAKTGSNIPSDIFLTDKYKYISAVIFTDRSLLDHFARESNELSICLNPYAANPIDVQKFKGDKLYTLKNGIFTNGKKI